MYLYRHKVRHALGDRLILWVNPRKVMFHMGSNQPYTKRVKFALHRAETALPSMARLTRPVHTALYSLEPFAIRDSLLVGATPIERNATFRKVADFISHADRPELSQWFGELQQSLHRDGRAFHKGFVFTTEAEIAAFIAGYVRDLIDSMRTRGYDLSKAPDIGTAMIAADGSILKSDAGNHRFSAARVLGVPRVPLEILGAHEAWMRENAIGRDTGRLRDALSAVQSANG